MVVSFIGSSLSLVVVFRVMTAPRRGAHRSQQSPSGRIESEDLEYEANQDRNLGERSVASEVVTDKDNSLVTAYIVDVALPMIGDVCGISGARA
jgi:hypothetical protein